MNVAVLYHTAIKGFKKKNCTGQSINCIYEKFDGETFFNDFIMKEPC